MGMFLCPRCDGLFDSKGGECIPALTAQGEPTDELVCEGCAECAEIFAYLGECYCGCCNGDPGAFYDNSQISGEK